MRLSIILPTNKTHVLTLSKLKAFDTSNIEVIVVADGIDVCENDIENAKVFKNLKIIKNGKCGVSNCRNKGIKEANGKFLWFVDNDDFILPDAFSLVESVLDNNADFYMFSSIVNNVNQSGFHLNNIEITDNFIEQGESAFLSLPNEHKPFVWNKIFLKSFLEKNSIFFDNEISLGEDALFCFECFLKAKTIKFSSKKVYQYNFNNKNFLIHTNENFFHYHATIVRKIIEKSNFKDYSNDYNDYFMELLSVSYPGIVSRKIIDDFLQLKKAQKNKQIKLKKTERFTISKKITSNLNHTIVLYLNFFKYKLKNFFPRSNRS